MRFPICLLLGLVLSSCSTGGEIIGGDKLDRSYATGGGAFDEGGNIIIAAAPKNFDGRMVICGARIQSKIAAFEAAAEDDVAQNARVEVDGVTVLRDLTAFNIVKMTRNVNGQPSTCLSTDLAWNGNPSDVKVIVPNYERRGSRVIVSRFRQGKVSQVIGERPPLPGELVEKPKPEIDEEPTRPDPR